MTRNRVNRWLIRWIFVAMCAYAAPSASATEADMIEAELIAGGISAQVTIFTPPAAAAPITDETADAPVQSFEEARTYLSPNPLAPLPIVQVNYTVPPGPSLSGLVSSAGVELGVNEPQLIESQLAVVEAVKHAVARGANLSGIEFNIEHGNIPATRILQALPNPNIYPAEQTFGTEIRPALAEPGPRARSTPRWIAPDPSAELLDARRVVYEQRAVVGAVALPETERLGRRVRGCLRRLEPQHVSLGGVRL